MLPRDAGVPPWVCSGLADLVLQDKTLAGAVQDARDGLVPALDLTAPSALRPFVVKGLVDAGRTVLAVAATAREAEDLVSALGGLMDPTQVAYYPAWETLPHERLSPRSDTVGRRLAVLRRLRHPGTDASNGPVKVVVAPVRSVLQPQVSGLADLEPVELTVGAEVELDDVVRRLAGAAYSRVDLVEKRGEFAVRGGIIDVFPPTEEHPLRVEFWGDEVEEIRSFAVADQRTLEPAAPAVGAAVPRAAADRRGARAGQGRWGRRTRSSPRSSRRSPTATPSRAWSRWPRCSSTRWRCSSTCCPTETHVLVLDPERARSRAHDLVATSEEFLEASWAAAAGGGAGADRPRQGVLPLARRRPGDEPGAGQGLVERLAVRPGPGRRRLAADAAARLAGRDRVLRRGRRGRRRRVPGAAGARRSRPTAATWSARSPTSRPGWRNDSRVVLLHEGHGPAQRMVEVLKEHDVPVRLRRVARRASPSAGLVHVTTATPRARVRRRRRSAWRCSPATT